jgi:hypothetical protein
VAACPVSGSCSNSKPVSPYNTSGPIVDAARAELHSFGMAFTLSLKPEVERRLRELGKAEHRSMHKTGCRRTWR